MPSTNTNHSSIPTSSSDHNDEYNDIASHGSHETVEVLRKRIAEQQKLLLERESRIVQLEGQNVRQSSTAANNNCPARRRYREQNSNNNMRMNRKQGIIIGLLLLVLFVVGRRQSQTLAGWNDIDTASITKPSNSKKRFGQTQVFSNKRKPPVTKLPVIKPHQSKPPDPVALLSDPRPAIIHRHECIRNIRRRHDELLGPYMQQSTSPPPSVLLVDPAYHRNVGDHMITLGELAWLERLRLNNNNNNTSSTSSTSKTAMTTTTTQCGYVQHGGFCPSCESVLMKLPSITTTQSPQHMVALWHGGGNWGDLWRMAQEMRIPSIPKLLSKGYTVIGMPQSFYYKDDKLKTKDAATLKQGIASAMVAMRADKPSEETRKRVVLTWREQESYEQAVAMYPFVTNLLVPDIAFQLGPFQRLVTPQGTAMQLDILLFLREDLESSLTKFRNNASIRSMLANIPGGDGLRFQIVDWKDRLDIFQSSDYFFTETSVQLLSLGRVVVCDRLHAAILCYLSGIPFVYIDQMTGKISKTLNVALEGCADAASSHFSRAQSLKEALQLAIGLLDEA